MRNFDSGGSGHCSLIRFSLCVPIVVFIGITVYFRGAPVANEAKQEPLDSSRLSVADRKKMRAFLVASQQATAVTEQGAYRLMIRGMILGDKKLIRRVTTNHMRANYPWALAGETGRRNACDILNSAPNWGEGKLPEISYKIFTEGLNIESQISYMLKKVAGRWYVDNMYVHTTQTKPFF